jgi:hypothetical protein
MSTEPEVQEVKLTAPLISVAPVVMIVCVPTTKVPPANKTMNNFWRKKKK